MDRPLLALALGKSKRPEAVDVLLGVLGDCAISGHAAEALATLQSERARSGLTSLLDDDRNGNSLRCPDDNRENCDPGAAAGESSDSRTRNARTTNAANAITSKIQFSFIDPLVEVDFDHYGARGNTGVVPAKCGEIDPIAT